MIKNARELSNILPEDIKDGTFTDWKRVKHIGYGCFAYSEKLLQLIVPKGVKTIEDDAFYMCKNLETITLPKSLKRIQPNAFNKCIKLASINLPNKINEILHGTFIDCVSLKEITLPKKLKKISAQAFMNCSSLEKIDIPDSVTKIETNSFFDCKKLKEVKLPKNLEKLNMQTFSGCSSLKAIELPPKIKELGTRLFSNSGLETIKIPKKVKSLPNSLFENCKNLKNVLLNEGITSIGKKCFSGCSSLKRINIPSSVETIFDNAFENCSSLEEIEYKGKVYNLDEYKNRFLKSCKDNTTNVIKLILKTEGNFKFKNNAKFPVDFIMDFNKSFSLDEFKCICQSFNTKYFKTVQEKYFCDLNLETYNVNAKNFYRLAYALGCFSNKTILVNDKRVSVAQKASVFFENLLDKKIITPSTFEDSFNNLMLKECKTEFLKYVTEQKTIDGKKNVYFNFIDLLNNHPKDIGKIINGFDQILRVKVVDEKGRIVENPSIKKKIEVFLSRGEFINVNNENDDIAKEFSKFETIDQELFDEAQEIRGKSKGVRHIVEKPLKEKAINKSIEELMDKIDSNLVDSKKLITKLKEMEFTYEWLDKQDPKNFTLGLYCDCCANIVSTLYGKEIMKESILNEAMQNLVINDADGKIVAKATIYVNKEEGYAVFNEIEMNREYGDEFMEEDFSDSTQREKIYDAFKRGTKAFIEKYNKIHSDKPIKQVNIGWGYNRLKQVIRKHEQISEELLETPESFKDTKETQYVIYKK